MQNIKKVFLLLAPRHVPSIFGINNTRVYQTKGQNGYKVTFSYVYQNDSFYAHEKEWTCYVQRVSWKLLFLQVTTHSYLTSAPFFISYFFITQTRWPRRRHWIGNCMVALLWSHTFFCAWSGMKIVEGKCLLVGSFYRYGMCFFIC